jgi:hypothetical protein
VEAFQKLLLQISFVFACVFHLPHLRWHRIMWLPLPSEIFFAVSFATFLVCFLNYLN